MKKLIFLLSIVFVIVFIPGCGTSNDKPLVHTVYFWFKKDASIQDINAFTSKTEDLRKIESVGALYYGQPANTTRPIVEKSYHWAVVVHFKDLEAHNTYQADSIHTKLIAQYKHIFERVMVTDFQ